MWWSTAPRWRSVPIVVWFQRIGACTDENCFAVGLGVVGLCVVIA